MAQRKPGRNGYVMRDGLYGAGLGAVLGGIAGGLGALAAKKGEYILLGASIGVLTGTVGGMAVGFVEGYRKYSVSVAPVTQSDGSLSFIPAVVGRF
jgi:L-aminopeptidase/D-esterase-like protein